MFPSLAVLSYIQNSAATYQCGMALEAVPKHRSSCHLLPTFIRQSLQSTALT